MCAVPVPWCRHLSWRRLLCRHGLRQDRSDADEHDTRMKKSRSPQTLGREQTYLGENSLSSRYFRSLWLCLLSNMQAESDVFVMETGQSGGWGEEKGECPPTWVREVASSERTQPCPAEKTALSSHSPSPLPPPREGPDHRPKPPESPLPPIALHTPEWSSPALSTLALVGKCYAFSAGRLSQSLHRKASAPCIITSVLG